MYVNQTTNFQTRRMSMFRGCLTYSSPGTLIPVNGMMKSEQYIQVLQSKVLPVLLEQLPNGNGIFQQDLAPCHTSKRVKEFMKNHDVNVLPWPGNSLDLNPIENLWSIIKTRSQTVLLSVN